MKKAILFIYACMLVMSMHAIPAEKSVSDVSKSLVVREATGKKMSEAQARILVQRLEEIKAMDKSELTSDQKHELRNEVVAIREKMRDGGYVFISSTTIIIILLLIILL